MKRGEFLKGIGLAGIGSALPWKKANALTGPANKTTACVLIPSETAGPFPLDLTANTTFFRQDIRETKAGVQLNLKLRIIGIGNCLPMQNVRVNIWHCDKEGLYSGYDQTNNPGQAGLTYLRGYQFTDANGEVEFITIFPGWYTGRICHIHFQVWVSSSHSAISQLTFDINAKNNLYTANSSIYTKGTDPLTYSSDNIFSDGYSYQLATLTPSTTSGYDSFLEIGIQGNGTTDVGHIEKENAKQFSLRQNFPNPYMGETTIPFSLVNTSDVELELYDFTGRKVAVIKKENLSPGEHSISINATQLGIATGNYVYQITVTNANGIFRACKVMTSVT